MARAIVRLVALAAVGLLALPAFTQQAPVKSVPPKAEKPAAPSLEELLSQALKNNPDIRVGEAKVREAEAELSRTRLTVAQKVAGVYHSLELARKSLEQADQHMAESKQLYQRGAIAPPELRSAQLAREKAAAEVARLEAELPTLLGKMPGQVGADKGATGRAAQVEPAVEAGIRWLHAVQADDLRAEGSLAALALSRIYLANESAPQGTLADKIRKALDKPIEANYKDKLLADVMKDFEKHLEGIPFRVLYQFPGSSKMDLNMGQVPLGTAIQSFNDLTPQLRFVVRDYGILVTEKGNLPPGAVDLYDFWKSSSGKEKPKGESGETAKPKQ